MQVSEALEEYFAADERAAAAALQRSLVPSTLPVIEGLDLAGRYLPGQGGVSGDWYDVFGLPGGRVGMVMGDVAGHGLAASVVMGRLRSALRAYSLEYDAPEDVLAHLDAKIMHFEPGAMATAVYAITQPPFDQIRLSSAGHFMPILLSPDGVARQVELPVSLPLGVDPAFERTSGVVPLEPGSALVLFTDGLLERRTVSSRRSAEVFGSIDDALDELCRILRCEDADVMSSHILDTMLTLEPPSDDVALLVIRHEAAATADRTPRGRFGPARSGRDETPGGSGQACLGGIYTCGDRPPSFAGARRCSARCSGRWGWPSSRPGRRGGWGGCCWSRRRCSCWAADGRSVCARTSSSPRGGCSVASWRSATCARPGCVPTVGRGSRPSAVR